MIQQGELVVFWAEQVVNPTCTPSKQGPLSLPPHRHLPIKPPPHPLPQELTHPHPLLLQSQVGICQHHASAALSYFDVLHHPANLLPMPRKLHVPLSRVRICLTR